MLRHFFQPITVRQHGELCKNKANVNFHVGDKCVLRKALEIGSEVDPNKAYKDIATRLICDFGYDIHLQLFMIILIKYQNLNQNKPEQCDTGLPG